MLQRAAAAGQQPPTSFGLREDEISVSVDIITHGLPALRLFGNHKAADGSDVYELFADIFIALNVRSLCTHLASPLQAQHTCFRLHPFESWHAFDCAN